MNRPTTILLPLLLAVALLASGGLAFAQRSATLSGSIVSEDELPDGTRVAVHLAENNNAWGLEVASAAPAAGTFTVVADPVPADRLRPFRSGAVLLPGLQNEYRVTPEDVSYARGLVNMYVDDNGNGSYDRLNDRYFLGVARLGAEGFFSLLYVDRPATLSAVGVDLELQAGWNVFTARFSGDGPSYAIEPAVSDVLLDVFLPPAP